MMGSPAPSGSVGRQVKSATMGLPTAISYQGVENRPSWLAPYHLPRMRAFVGLGPVQALTRYSTVGPPNQSLENSWPPQSNEQLRQ